jgi:hypothetical protein
MKHHLDTYLPRHFFTTSAVWQSFLLGMVHLLLLITQLFTYEDFPAVIRTWSMPGGEPMVVFLAVILPLAELVSLPYLVSMNISPRILSLSRYATLTVGALWVIISLWLTISTAVAESGLFGATISIPAGLWMLGYAVFLLITAVVIVLERKKLYRR